jgi:hypothetical protein
MTTLFPAGQLVARSDFLSLISRSAMIQAIVRHVTDPRPIRDGEPIRSEHQHDGIGFHLLTMEDRTKTVLRLDEASIRLACAADFDIMPCTAVAQTHSGLDCRLQPERVPVWDTSGYQHFGSGAVHRV